MQLRFNRYVFAITLLVIGGVDWTVIAVAINGGADITYAMGGMVALMAAAMVLVGLMLKPPRLASIEGDMLRVGRGKAHLSDILRISTEHGLSFAVRARDAEGFWAGSMGERMLALKRWRIDGGRKAVARFVAQVEAARKEVAPLAVEAPPAPPPPLRPRRDGIDSDPISPLPRPVGLQAAPPMRAGFGRKGL